MTTKHRVEKLPVWSARNMDFNQLAYLIGDGKIAPMVCQGCGFIHAGEEDCIPTETPGVRQCVSCKSFAVVQCATADQMNAAFDTHYPWTCCEHCEYYFTFDDDCSALIDPDQKEWEPGYHGCPNCGKLTI